MPPHIFFDEAVSTFEYTFCMQHDEHDEWKRNQDARKAQLKYRMAQKKAAKAGKPLPPAKPEEQRPPEPEDDGAERIWRE